jgi:hypothetical protein
MSVSNENKELLCYTCEIKLLHHDNIIDGVAEFGYLICSLCYSKFCCIECGSGHSKATEDYYCQDCEESSDEESSDESDCSSVHSDHSIEVNKVIELIHSVPFGLECDIYSGCEIGGMTDEELENFKIEILIEIERYKLIKEFYRLEKMSPKAMIELNKKYD